MWSRTASSRYRQRATGTLPAALVSLFACWLGGADSLLAQPAGNLEAVFRRIDAAVDLLPMQATRLQFPTHHPQGMTRVGEVFFVSAVETRQRPSRPAADSRYDRTPGSGIGHLFKLDAEGQLLAQTSLGEGSLYHPGGIDYDGQWLWVPVAEYRPDSHSIIYRIDPDTLAAEEMFRFDDHLGAVVHDARTGTLQAVSWGARRHYTWQSDARGWRTEDYTVVDRGADGVQYQDCQYVGGGSSLCSGMETVTVTGEEPRSVGAIELIDLASNRIAHRLTFTDRAPGGEQLSRNPFYFDAGNGDYATLYFIPEDDQSWLRRFRVWVSPGP